MAGSASKRRRQPDVDDIWTIYQSEIRSLYTSNRIEEVKTIMEAKPDWPRKFSIKTWQEKLGDLRIRKVICKEAWHTIWQHVQPYLEDPSRPRGDLKLKRTKAGMKVVLYVYESRYTWDRAWKGMKSAGAVGQPRQVFPRPLPSGFRIEVQRHSLSRSLAAPHPVSTNHPSASVSTQPRVSLDKFGYHIHPQDPLADVRQLQIVEQQALTSPAAHDTLDLDRLADRVVAMNLSTTPVLSFLNKYLDIIGAPGAQVYMNAAMGAEGELITRPFFNSRLFPDTAETDFSCLMRQTSFNYSLLSEGVLKRQLGLAHATPTNQSQAYLFLSMAIYLFSNNLVEMTCLADSYFALFAKLDTVFELVSQEVFQALLQSRLASIRVAGEKLLLVAGRCKQVRFFRILIDFGFADGWIDGLSWRGPDYLWCAASMGLEDVVQRLLTKGCRPDQRLVSINGYRLSRPQSVIDAAIENHHFECGQILLRYCDVNRPLQTPWNFLEDKEPRCLTTFQSFILHLSTASPTDSNQSWIRGLQMMLNAGANPDEPFTWQMEPEPGSGRKDASVMTRYFRQILPSRPANHRSKGWPSILDYLFYFNRPVFDQFSHYSQSFKSQVTRAGVLLALEKGNLDHYLELKKSSRNNEDVKELLQTILAEQFILRRYMSDKFDFTCKKTPPKPTDLDLVHALLDLGINFESGVTFEIRETIYDIINYFSGDLGLPPGTDWHCDKVTFLLHAVTSAYPLAADLESECHAVQLLIDRGAVVTSWDLEQAARRKGTRLLKLLLAHISYIATNGTRALAIAAKLNNIEAVGLLLDSGVDVNSEFDVQKPKMRELSILAYTLFHWAGPQDDSSQMTNILLARGAILRVSQAETHVSDLLSQLFYYSTACESPSSYKMACFLVDNGLQHGDPYILSASMLERCVSSSSRFRHLERPRRALFKYLLRKGALVRPGSPLTAWILADGETSIVQELLKKGADKNSYNTEHELWVLTPLQAAAMACDEETVLLLLRVGANVNAPARGKQGRTALQAICSFGAKTQQEETGKRRIIQSLLDHGADVNAAPARKYGVTALQIAAHEGDLAIVILLLRHGADPNAPLCQLGFLFSGPNWGHMEEGNALDLAAREGRLDMVKLLLNANALSFKRGESGYDEAIELAEKNGHIVVADLIRQHAAQGASDEDLRNPYFSQPPRDWREYNYESDDDSDLDDDSESD